MNTRQLAYFKKMLEEMKHELSQDIDRTVHTMQDEATIFADPNDRASQESDMSLELRNRDRERKLIKKIEETIGRRSAEEFEATHERHADLLDRYQDDSPEWVRRARARALPTRVER